jgi:hypothetical protein
MMFVIKTLGIWGFGVPKLAQPAQVAEHLAPGDELQDHVQVAIVLQKRRPTASRAVRSLCQVHGCVALNCRVGLALHGSFNMAASLGNAFRETAERNSIRKVCG